MALLKVSEVSGPSASPRPCFALEDKRRVRSPQLEIPMLIQPTTTITSIWPSNRYPHMDVDAIHVRDPWTLLTAHRRSPIVVTSVMGIREWEK